MKYEIIDGRFTLPTQRGQASFSEILKWQTSGSRQKWPKHIDNKTYPPPPQRVDGKEIAATWIGHSTVLLQVAGLNVLTDPFFSKRASPSQLIGPSRVRAPGIALKDLPPLDLILLSHSHYDHMDKPTLKWLARNTKAKLITPLNNRRHAPGFETVELDWHQSHTHGEAKVTALPALHWSKRTLGDTNKSLWAAFMLETPLGLIYFGADTGFGTGETFREARELFGAPSLSLLPIGAYEPRWFMAPQHMNPEEAVEAHILLGSKQSLAIHHGTVQLTDEAIDAPVAALDVALAARKLTAKDFTVADIGETLLF
ncbi:MBL fold metallo-hydrolase [Aestuariivirga litoralis]|uniref:MBL fold metallo-hydrolase n=1 Tax=Aestuariivirga litoralis TaxID=2650924 RepID=UPI0018C4BF75|nr:MBL fold metallo-hydrolase [Aestuariivirga litoralis]MBG1233604.1 MBL fold metallo-hydrolase [Aestuariivirga litoralis]